MSTLVDVDTKDESTISADGRDRGAIPLDVASERMSSLAVPTDPRGLIAYLAARKIRGFCGTIDDDGEYLSNVSRGNRSLTAHLTADYHRRFLIELIQNGSDIHPRDRPDGEIEVLLDVWEGEHGTLYVANRGHGFTAENVNALCDVGMSSKPPGEAIGNKGLGFRSVHHITDAPEIYSQFEPIIEKTRFDGFCFAFANEADLDIMLPNPRHRELARQDLPHFHVPRWLSEQPRRVLEYSCRGFATVIRLPLRDAAALQAVYDEFATLQAQTAPMLLFLGRLQCLTARAENAGAARIEPVVLGRHEAGIENSNGALSVADLGAAGRFLIARRAIPETVMKAAIKSGADSNQLHPSWKDWLLDQIERGIFAGPSEAMFVILGEHRELEPHADLREELLRRTVQAAMDDPRPSLSGNEVETQLRELADTPLPEAAVWRKVP